VLTAPHQLQVIDYAPSTFVLFNKITSAKASRALYDVCAVLL